MFRGDVPPTPLRQVYGGHFVGQAMRAAMRTVPRDSQPHALRISFPRAGRTEQVRECRVRRTRDGSSFSSRSVDVLQQGRLLALVSISFTGIEGGADYQEVMPPAPEPHALAPLPERVERDPEAWPMLYHAFEHFDVRYVTAPADRLTEAEGAPASSAQVWLRALAPQPYDSSWHACALAYVSDLTLLSVTLPVQGLRPAAPGLRMASLDHMVWFHRPTRVDEWLLYDQKVVSTHGSLGLARGELFATSGSLVASVAQQGLVQKSQTSKT